MVGPRRRPGLSVAERASLKTALEEPTLELIPLASAMDQAGYLPPGSRVSVTCSPSRGLDATLDLAERLHAAGFRAVPHLAARIVRDRGHLCDILARIAAGPDRALVVAGDAREPGEYGRVEATESWRRAYLRGLSSDPGPAMTMSGDRR